MSMNCDLSSYYRMKYQCQNPGVFIPSDSLKFLSVCSCHLAAAGDKITIVMLSVDIYAGRYDGLTLVMRHDALANHNKATKWKHFSRYWPFVLGIHRSSVNSLYKGQFCGALMFSLIFA